jgi:hypothetical protein
MGEYPDKHADSQETRIGLTGKRLFHLFEIRSKPVKSRRPPNFDFFREKALVKDALRFVEMTAEFVPECMSWFRAFARTYRELGTFRTPWVRSEDLWVRSGRSLAKSDELQVGKPTG